MGLLKLKMDLNNFTEEAADALNFKLRARSLSACLFGRVTTGPTAAFHNTENAAPTFIRIHLAADDNLVDKLSGSNQQTKICMLYNFLPVVVD